MANPVASYFSHLKKNMDSGALLFLFKDRAPIAIHKSFLFKKYDGENGDTRSLFSTFISSVKMDSPPLGVYFKNLEGNWVNIQALGDEYPDVDPITNAELSGYTNRFSISKNELPAVEYTDGNGFVHYINERDGEEKPGAIPIEIDESRELTVAPFSMENPQLSWNEREMMRDLVITVSKEGHNENILTWLNGRFLAPTKDNVNINRFYIRSGMDYVDSWAIDQPNTAPKLSKRGEIKKSGWVATKFNYFNKRGDGYYPSNNKRIIAVDEESDRIAILSNLEYTKLEYYNVNHYKTIDICKLSTGEFIKNVQIPLFTYSRFEIPDSGEENGNRLINGYKNFIYVIKDRLLYRMNIRDENPSFILFAGRITAPANEVFVEGDLATSKNVFTNSSGKPNFNSYYNGINNQYCHYLAFEGGVYIANRGVLGYLDHDGIFHHIFGVVDNNDYFNTVLKVFKVTENVYYVFTNGYSLLKLQIDSQTASVVHNFNPNDESNFVSVFGSDFKYVLDMILSIDNEGIMYVHRDTYSSPINNINTNCYIRKVCWNKTIKNIFGKQSNLTNNKIKIGDFGDDLDQGLNVASMQIYSYYYHNNRIFLRDSYLSSNMGHGYFTIEYKDNSFIKFKPSIYIEEDTENDNVRFDRRLRLFKWVNVKVNNWIQPVLLKDYPVLLNEDDDYVNVYKEITFSEVVNPKAHVIINNGRILPENDYYIDPRNPKKIILKRIQFEAQNYYRDAKDYYLNYIHEGVRDPRFIDPIDYVLARGAKYPALEATRTKFGYQSYSLVNFESIDGRPLRLIRHRNTRTCFPYHDEIAFDEIGINDVVIINGYFTPYEWKEDNVIKLPITKTLPLYRTISTLDKADVYRLKFVFD